MYRRKLIMSSFDKNTFLPRCIALNWCAGLFLGILADRFYGDSYRICLLLAARQIPEFAGILSVTLFPLLISACAVYLQPRLLILLALVYGFQAGLSTSGVVALFGSAGPLLGGLLFFSLILYHCVFSL